MHIHVIAIHVIGIHVIAIRSYAAVKGESIMLINLSVIDSLYYAY